MRIGIKNSNINFVAHAILASFGLYFCMYAFRKPFTVATYEGLTFFGLDYKILLVICQVIGYASSKFFGIKIISELKLRHRKWYLLGLIILGELSLVLFAIIPAPYAIVFMFCNGFSLGMVWGIVFSYLEGRKFTEILGVALCASFIVSSGAVKSVGLYLMNSWQVTELWMPAITGLIFILPFYFFTMQLEKIPPPTALDIALRSDRVPMTKRDKKEMIMSLFFPMVILVFFYMLLTSFRDFRDSFSRELWDSIGYVGDAAIYSWSEIIVAFFVLLLLGLVFFVKDNFKAMLVYHYILVLGTLVVGASTLLFQMELLSPLLWMISVGFGLYVCYVPFNCIFFDRVIAAFDLKGNSGFLIYIADSFGYLGSIMVLLYKNLVKDEVSWLHFFINAAYVISILGIVIATISLLYFKRKKKYTIMEEKNFVPVL